MGAAHSSTPPPANRRLGVIIGVLCALLAVAVVLLGVLWARIGPAPSPTDAARPTPPASATPTPSATPTLGSTAAPGTPRPGSCDELYSPEMVAAFGDLVLNPAWIADQGLELRIGGEDPALQGVVDANDTLICHWGQSSGPSDVGVTTNLVWLSDEDRSAVEAYLRGRGDDCYDEAGGIRCLSEGSNDQGYFGESHFLRDGIWLATEYSNAGPDGYTVDMVQNLWPQG